MIYLLFILAGLLLFFLFGPNKYIDKWAQDNDCCGNNMEEVKKHDKPDND